jgi:hypothetical protein
LWARPDSAEVAKKSVVIIQMFPHAVPDDLALCNSDDHANNKPTAAAAYYIDPGGARRKWWSLTGVE